MLETFQWGRRCWWHFWTHTVLFSSSWTMRSQWMQTATAQYCGVWSKWSGWNILACYPSPWDPNPHTDHIIVLLTEQFCCECLAWPLYSRDLCVATVTFLDHWRSTSKDLTTTYIMYHMNWSTTSRATLNLIWHDEMKIIVRMLIQTLSRDLFFGTEQIFYHWDKYLNHFSSCMEKWKVHPLFLALLNDCVQVIIVSLTHPQMLLIKQLL
jgi:hypothetical protein